MGHGFEGSIALAPLDAGVLDGHVSVGVLTLNLQDKTRGDAIRRQLLSQGAAQEIWQILILSG